MEAEHARALFMKLIRHNGELKVLGRNEVMRLLLEKAKDIPRRTPRLVSALPQSRLGGDLETKNA